MTKPIRRSASLATLAILAFAMAGCGSSENQTTQEGQEAEKAAKSRSALTRERPITIPEGTTLSVVLDQSLSSNGNHAGDAFDATLADPVEIDGKTVIQKDARVKGRVTDAQASGRLQTPASISVTLSSIEVGNSWHDIDTSTVGFRGKSHKTRDIEMIGGGSAAGAIIGAIAGHGKGAAIGAAAGAGAGTAAAAMTGKKDIQLAAESHLTFRLARALTFNSKP